MKKIKHWKQRIKDSGYTQREFCKMFNEQKNADVKFTLYESFLSNCLRGYIRPRAFQVLLVEEFLERLGV